MTRNEVINKIRHTRLDECPYIEVYTKNGEKRTNRNWANACANTVNAMLNDNMEYTVDFGYPYANRYYTEYGLIKVYEV